jgi:hypothetical protein
VANNLLLEALSDGAWDGRDVDNELVRMSETHGVHYVTALSIPASRPVRMGHWSRPSRRRIYPYPLR